MKRSIRSRPLNSKKQDGGTKVEIVKKPEKAEMFVKELFKLKKVFYEKKNINFFFKN